MDKRSSRSYYAGMGKRGRYEDHDQAEAYRLSILDWMTPETLRRWLEDSARRGGEVRLKSRERTYSFYWDNGQLSVRKGAGERFRSNVEAVVRGIRLHRICPACGAVFQRDGKRKFCQPQHAARHRKRRWAERRRAAEDQHERTAFAKRAAKRGEAAAKAERRRGPYRIAVTRSEESL
jgi:hypothetical protein